MAEERHDNNFTHTASLAGVYSVCDTCEPAVYVCVCVCVCVCVFVHNLYNCLPYPQLNTVPIHCAALIA